MEDLQEGLLTEVTSVMIGTELVTDHLAGATELSVYDASDFSEDGGLLRALVEPADPAIPSVELSYIYSYVTADHELNNIQLSSPLTSDLESEMKIYLEPASIEKWGQVKLDDGEEAVIARFEYSVGLGVEDGIRSVDQYEDVNVQLQGTELVIVDMPGKESYLDGTAIDPETLPDSSSTPVVAPTQSPIPELISGPAAVVVNYDKPPEDIVDLYIWVQPEVAEGAPIPLPPTPGTPDFTDSLHIVAVSPGVFVYTDSSGTPLPINRPVWVALWAHNQGGAAPTPSAWVETRVGEIQPQYLNLLAGSVIAQRLQTETLRSVSIVGSTLDIHDALYAEPGYAEVKADLIEAQSAIFHGNVTRRGTNNFLEGREVAASGVTDPGTPPTVSPAWPSVQVGNGTEVHDAMVVDTATSEIIVARYGPSIDVYDLNTGAFKRTAYQRVLGVGDTSYEVLDMCRHGDWWYVAIKPARVDDCVLWRISALPANEGVRDTGYEWSILKPSNLANPQAFSIASDGTEINIVQISSAGDYRYRRINPTAKTTTLAYVTLPGVTPGTLESIAGLVAVKNATWRDLYVQPYKKDQIKWGDSTGSMALINSTNRARPYGETVIVSDGDYTIDVDGKRYLHINTLLNTGERPYTYTWYDSDIGGVGVGESKASPPRLYTVPRGAHVTVKTPLPPDDGSNDSPDTVRIYIDDYRQSPHLTPLELISGRTLSAIDFGGLPSPLSSDFDNRLSLVPGGYESTKGDGTGPIWELDGNGPGRVGPLSWNVNGEMVGEKQFASYETVTTPNVPTAAWTTRAGWTHHVNDTGFDFGFSVTGGGVFSCTKAGIYLITASLSFASNATNRRQFRIIRNGTHVLNYASPPPVSGGATGASLSGAAYFAVGDTYEVQGWQNSGANLAWSTLGDQVQHTRMFGT